MKIKQYIKLLRPKHYCKNILVFVPLFFSGQVMNLDLFLNCIFAFLAFSFCASLIYIVNDLKDVELDKLHEKKKHRPIASGRVSKKEAVVLAVICSLLSIIFHILSGSTIPATIALITYFIANLIYSLWGKNKPIVDVTLLASSYFLRVYYGAMVTGIIISDWLYLSVIAAAFFLGFGKRRNELKGLKENKETRTVLKFYNENFLNNNMYMFLGLGIVFYSLWSMTTNMLITVPLLIVICMKYVLIIEGDSDGDPVDTMLSDKIFLFLIMLFALMLVWMVYFK